MAPPAKFSHDSDHTTISRQPPLKKRFVGDHYRPDKCKKVDCNCNLQGVDLDSEISVINTGSKTEISRPGVSRATYSAFGNEDGSSTIPFETNPSYGTSSNDQSQSSQSPVLGLFKNRKF